MYSAIQPFELFVEVREEGGRKGEMWMSKHYEVTLTCFMIHHSMVWLS